MIYRREGERCLPIVEPMKMKCANCGGEILVYPYPYPTGIGICKACTPESSIDFIKRMSEYIFAENKKISPIMIWMGFDSKNSGLPSPGIDEFKSLFWELSKHFNVILKRKEILKKELKK